MHEIVDCKNERKEKIKFTQPEKAFCDSILKFDVCNALIKRIESIQFLTFYFILFSSQSNLIFNKVNENLNSKFRE